jgi:protoporphyrinogen IX oxidase
MMTELSHFYLWIKAFHIISVICWMAALFYLPRLFVYHSQTTVGSDMSSQFLIMEERLIRIIMNPAMILTYIFGILLLITPGIVNWHQGWIHVKLTMVLLLSGLHGLAIRWYKDFKNDSRNISHVYFRVANEIPVVIMVVIVIMVVVKPF